MIGTVYPFDPITTANVTANATTAQTANLGSAGESVLVYNPTSDMCFVNLGTTNVASATTASTPVPAGASRLFRKGGNVTTASVISNSVNTGKIYFTSGNGTAY